MKRILLLSGYDAKSHRYWRRHLVSQFQAYQWTILALPDRHFSWRMGGNAISFAAQFEKELQQPYDLVIATSMTDLCGLFGLYPHLAQSDSALYFHENQLAYPASKEQPDVIHYQLNSIKSAMAAKRLIFNSNYNKKSFLTGVKKVAQMVPESLPNKLTTNLENKSKTIPVPLTEACFSQSKSIKAKQPRPALTVTWNHRWEYDKAPETLLKVLKICQQENLAIQFNVIGQQFRQSPEAFKLIQKNHKSQIKHLGYIEDRLAYLRVLQQSDVVLSTALHEFQGLAVMEAVASGCVPLLPDRLAYQDFYHAQFRYPSTPQSSTREAHAIVKTLKRWLTSLPSPPDMKSLAWSEMRNQYQNILMTN